MALGTGVSWAGGGRYGGQFLAVGFGSQSWWQFAGSFCEGQAFDQCFSVLCGIETCCILLSYPAFPWSFLPIWGLVPLLSREAEAESQLVLPVMGAEPCGPGSGRWRPWGSPFKLCTMLSPHCPSGCLFWCDQ